MKLSHDLMHYFIIPLLYQQESNTHLMALLLWRMRAPFPLVIYRLMAISCWGKHQHSSLKEGKLFSFLPSFSHSLSNPSYSFSSHFTLPNLILPYHVSPCRCVVQYYIISYYIILYYTTPYHTALHFLLLTQLFILLYWILAVVNIKFKFIFILLILQINRELGWRSVRNYDSFILLSFLL